MTAWHRRVGSHALPGVLRFGGLGVAGTVDAVDGDPDLQPVVGASTRIQFDMND